MKTNIEIISKVISKKYQGSNLSKHDIALKTGLSQNTINNAIHGKNLTLNTMDKILEVFGMSIEDLVNEAKGMGHPFQRPQSKITVPTVDIKAVKTRMANGETTLQIASKLGVTEGDLTTLLQDDLNKASAVKKVNIVEVN